MSDSKNETQPPPTPADEESSQNPEKSAQGSTPAKKNALTLQRLQKLAAKYGYDLIPRNQPSPQKYEVNLPDKGSSAELPDVFRTVINESGLNLARNNTFSSLTEEEYLSINDQSSIVAFEIQKRVKSIPPPPNGSKASLRGNPLLEGAIVDRVISEKMIIRSPQLLSIIKQTVFWPSSTYHFSSRELEISAPYRSIGVYYDSFQKRLKADGVRLEEKEKEKKRQELEKRPVLRQVTIQAIDRQIDDLITARKHLHLLLKEVNRVQANNREEEIQRHSKGEVTFDMLWMLLKPGTYVYACVHETLVAGRVRLLIWNSSPRSRHDDEYIGVTVCFWYLDHNGSTINRREHKVEIIRFEGAKRIVDLAIYPENYAPDHEETRKARIATGKLYIQCVRNRFALCLYAKDRREGMISTHNSNPLKPQYHKAYHGKVIVDPHLHYREQGATEGVVWVDDSDTYSSTDLGPEMRKFIKLDPEKDEDSFTDNHFFLLSPWIRGFTLSTRGDRDWVWLNVNNITLYKPNTDLINTVALPEEKLDIIKAIAYKSSETSEPALNKAYIDHKGESRVVILHGFPGLGKTYTVECIAELMNRPLLRLTCAELGLEATKLEKTIARNLRRAERWNAIVLIDEADVFMGKRTDSTQTSKEALVAVFLRALEYYSGVIFLTTNRIQAFDMAIIDRTLLVVPFTALDQTQRHKIRAEALDELKKDESLKIDGGVEPELKKIDADGYDWDGREIVQTLRLAEIFTRWEHCNSNEKVKSSKPTMKGHMVIKAMNAIRQHAVKKDGAIMDELDDEKGPDESLKFYAYETEKLG